MLKYQYLIITHPENQLVDLLTKMKEATKGAFIYQKMLALEYAKSIFVKEDHVGCFKTRRASLAESSVWVVITENELKVTNITPTAVSNLGVTEYNIILRAFFTDFIAQFIDESWTECVTISGERITLQNILSVDTYNALIKWESGCNKSSPITHPTDRKNWMDFIMLLHKEEPNFSVSDFSQWLSEDKKWPTAYNNAIYELEINLEYSLELLEHYDGTIL